MSDPRTAIIHTDAGGWSVINDLGVSTAAVKLGIPYAELSRLARGHPR